MLMIGSNMCVCTSCKYFRTIMIGHCNCSSLPCPMCLHIMMASGSQSINRPINGFMKKKKQIRIKVNYFKWGDISNNNKNAKGAKCCVLHLWKIISVFINFEKSSGGG